MGMLDVVSFLTIIPYGRGRLEGAARSVHLFPAAGLLIGAVAGLAGLAASAYAPPLVAGIAVAAVLYIVTGMHHADGLADTADGLMKHGTHKERIAAMRDGRTGAAGVTALVLCIACVVAAASQRAGWDLLLLAVLSEMGAKYGMVVAAYAGRPAARGTGAAFCGAADTKRFVACTALWIAPLALAPGAVAFAAAAGATGLVMVCVAKYRFGGVTGDVLGATNEVARAACMAVAVSV